MTETDKKYIKKEFKDEEDPSDTPPPTIYGEEIDNLGHREIDDKTIESQNINIQEVQINLEIKTSKLKNKDEPSNPYLVIKGDFPELVFYSSTREHNLNIEQDTIQFNGTTIQFTESLETIHVNEKCIVIRDSERCTYEFLDGEWYSIVV